MPVHHGNSYPDIGCDPLLADQHHIDAPLGLDDCPSSVPPRSSQHAHTGFNAWPWQARRPRTVVCLIALIKFVIVVSGMLIMFPMYRLMEDLICHRYYDDSSDKVIDEMKCKVDEVQSYFSTLLGWSSFARGFIALLVTYPYGMLADRIGRKPTILISYGGTVASFVVSPLLLYFFPDLTSRHPYLLIGGTLFQFFGGSVNVLMATLYATAADVSAGKDKATSFLYLTFGSTAGGLLGPLLAGLLMKQYGPWLPILLVLCVMPPITIVAVLCVPETLVIKDIGTQHTRRQPNLARFWEHMASGLKELRVSLRIMSNTNVVLVLVTFLVQSARVYVYTSLMAQYVSKHFGWKLADVSMLLSPLGVLNLIVLAALPKLSDLLIGGRFKYSGFGKDLFLTRVSTSLLVLGAVIESLSHNVVFFLIGLVISTLGAADSPLARATVSHYVDPGHTSRLYAVISTVEIVGEFIGAPVVAWLFNRGLALKGIWIGLPWAYIALLCAICWLALAFVHPPTKHIVEDHFHDDGSDVEDEEPPLTPVRLE